MMNDKVTPRNKFILPTSKGIKKPKNLDPEKTLESNRIKKYKTFDKQAKWIIIKGIMQELDITSQGERFSPAYLLNRLQSVNLNDYNPVLTKLLLRHVDSFVASSENLKKWRRKIKYWIENFDKPEKRGRFVVQEDKLDWFKARLIPILKELPFKKFDLIKTKVLNILREMHYNSNKRDQPFNSKTCSKHFWYEFLKKNSDIAAIYEAIPSIPNAKKKVDIMPDDSIQEKVEVKIEEKVEVKTEVKIETKIEEGV